MYDRQIRLWGLEAQNRIRKAHILVINLDGLTTEAIKNWVLAGISALTVVDYREDTSWHDLSAGFFWREADLKEQVCTRSLSRNRNCQDKTLIAHSRDYHQQQLGYRH